MQIDSEILKALCEKVEEPIRKMYRKLGADYDRGDWIILNQNLFHEWVGKILPERVRLSRYLPDDTPGVVLNGKYYPPYRQFMEPLTCK